MKVKSQLEGASLENLTSDPAQGTAGRIWERTDTGVTKVDTGAAIKTLVDTDSTQSLSNKTLTAPVIDAAVLEELGGFPAAPSAGYKKLYTLGSFATVYVHDSAGAKVPLASTNQTETLTNKDIDGGSASDTRRITLPKNATATLNGLTRKQGTVVYDTTTNTLKYDDGSNLIEIGQSSGVNPTGTILAFGGTSAPTGYLLCDGNSYLRATYPALFTEIGTAFGAADGTHFNVPDLRGRFLRGVASGQTTDPDRASRTAMATGGNTGDNVGSVQADAFKAHVHSTDGRQDAGNGNATFKIASSTGTTANIDTASTGGNETRPVNAYVNYIIKT